MRKLIVWCICLAFARLFCVNATGIVREIKRDIWYNISKETRRTLSCHISVFWFYIFHNEVAEEMEQVLATLKPEIQEKYKAMCSKPLQFLV